MADTQVLTRFDTSRKLRPQHQPIVYEEILPFFLVHEEDEYVLPPTKQQVQSPPLVLVDEEIGPRLEEFFLDTEDPAPIQKQSVAWQSRPTTDDEIRSPAPALEQEEPWVDFRQVVFWKASPFADDETSTQLITFGPDDEGAWGLRSQPVVKFPLPVTDDEALPIMFVDDDEPLTARIQSVVWVPRPFTYDEEWAPQPPVVALEQEEFPTPARQSVAWTGRPFTDDEVSTGLRNFYLEQEEHWKAQVQSVTWTCRSFTDDEIHVTYVPPAGDKTPALFLVVSTTGFLTDPGNGGFLAQG